MKKCATQANQGLYIGSLEISTNISSKKVISICDGSFNNSL
ncbi:hypothetical protein EC844_10685 [Acinetobacter calcoaceticus]|uniref:Uncharacterized protein n=1 Tax=Acinetobacter calcoaceticus TaxID=471 RepID=A0A4R1Y7B0_ACICA|nr:hypothetical protein EC844_10685 [Acinetobacter calcoaceticus]